jgi:hypothetical protein
LPSFTPKLGPRAGIRVLSKAASRHHAEGKSLDCKYLDESGQGQLSEVTGALWEADRAGGKGDESPYEGLPFLDETRPGSKGLRQPTPCYLCLGQPTFAAPSKAHGPGPKENRFEHSSRSIKSLRRYQAIGKTREMRLPTDREVS